MERIAGLDRFATAAAVAAGAASGGAVLRATGQAFSTRSLAGRGRAAPRSDPPDGVWSAAACDAHGARGPRARTAAILGGVAAVGVAVAVAVEVARHVP